MFQQTVEMFSSVCSFIDAMCGVMSGSVGELLKSCDQCSKGPMHVNRSKLMNRKDLDIHSTIMG